jgi:uncharacterized protein YndB with AHSA1/START domain
MADQSTEPIVVERTVPRSAQDAFRTYTARIGSWWHPAYTANAETLRAITIEPYVGGRIYASHGDLGEDVWGEVTAFEPGERFTHSFTLAQDPDRPTEVTVEFIPRGEDACEVRLTHGGWTAENADARATFTDWPLLLDRFVALAASSDQAEPHP